MMDSAETFADVLIIGGGPSGLLLAGKLGLQFNVCLLERGRIGQTSKFWLTNETRLARHGLLPAAQHRANRATIGTFQGSFAFAEGDFAVVDEAILLGLLIARCTNSSVRLIENTKVLNVANDGQELQLQTTRGPYRTRLVIDASGGGSPFAATFRLHRLEGFYSIYGAHLKDITLTNGDIVGAHIIHFGHPAPLFEVIPTSPTSAFCVVFLASKNVVEPTKLSSLFQEHIDHNPFFKRPKPASLGDLKMGIIPIGQASQRMPAGILPVGEAGMLQSPLLGAAFNEILEYADLIEDAVAVAFRRYRRGLAIPRVSLPIFKSLNDRIQLMLARRLVDGTLGSFERLVRFTKELGPSGAYRLFCTQLGWSDIPGLLKAAPKLLPLE